MALTAVPAGVNMVIEQAGGDQLDTGARVALGGGTALYLSFLTVAQRATARGVPAGIVATRAAAAVDGILLIVAGSTIVPVAFAAMMAFILAALAFVEVVFRRQSVGVPEEASPRSDAGPG